MKNKGNAKALFSQELIFQTLVTLMSEKEFKTITIQEITDKALVSRQTFYRNFTSKEEVLLMGVHEIVETYTEQLNTHADLSFTNIAYLFFSTMGNFIPFLRLLNRNKLNYLLSEELFQRIWVVYQERKSALLDQYGEEVIHQALLFSFGGFENLLSYWVEAATRPTPAAMKENFFEFVDLMLDERNKTVSL